MNKTVVSRLIAGCVVGLQFVESQSNRSCN